MDEVKVSIGRTNGPCTDQEISSQFKADQVETIKDTLAMVNAASQDKERWYVMIDDNGVVYPIVPVENRRKES